MQAHRYEIVPLSTLRPYRLSDVEVRCIVPRLAYYTTYEDGRCIKQRVVGYVRELVGPQAGQLAPVFKNLEDGTRWAYRLDASKFTLTRLRELTYRRAKRSLH